MRPFTQYFVEALLAAITAYILLRHDATSLAHLYLGSFPHSSLQILSSFVKLDGEYRCTAIFRSLQICSIRFKSRLELGHSRTLRDLVANPLLRGLGSVLRVVVLLEGEPSPQSEVLSRFSSRISQNIAPLIFPSILTSLPVPANEKHPHSMMLPLACFTVVMVFLMV